MNKLLNKIAALSIGLAMAIGVGVAVGNNRSFRATEANAGDLVFKLDTTGATSYDSSTKTLTSTIATANTYAYYTLEAVSGTGSSKTNGHCWNVTCGSKQSNTSFWLGSNSKQSAKMTLGNGSISGASGIAAAIGVQTTSTFYAAMFQNSGTKLSNIGKVTLTYTTPGGTAPSEAWIVYSTNGTSWSVFKKVTSLSTSGTDFEADATITGEAYYGFVIHSTGYCQFKDPKLSFYEGSTGGDTPTTYDLTYANGIQGYNADGSKTKVYSLAENAAHTVLAPSEVGISNNTTSYPSYVFDRWYDGTNYYNVGSTYTMPASAKTLTAQWVIGKALSYNANGGTTGSGTATTYVKSGATQTVSSCGFTAPSGKSFKEWNTLATGLGTSYSPTDEITNFTSDLELFAIWEKVTYVTIAYSGATTNMSGDNDAYSKFGLSATDWSVIGYNGKATNRPGLNVAGQIRLYYNASGSNYICVNALKANRTITKIDVETPSSNNNNYKVYEGDQTTSGTAVTGSNGTYNFSSNTTGFTIINGYSNNTQVYLLSIKVYFEDASVADEEIDLSNTPTEVGIGSNTASFVVLHYNLTSAFSVSTDSSYVTASYTGATGTGEATVQLSGIAVTNSTTITVSSDGADDKSFTVAVVVLPIINTNLTNMSWGSTTYATSPHVLTMSSTYTWGVSAGQSASPGYLGTNSDNKQYSTVGGNSWTMNGPNYSTLASAMTSNEYWSTYGSAIRMLNFGVIHPTSFSVTAAGVANTSDKYFIFASSDSGDSWTYLTGNQTIAAETPMTWSGNTYNSVSTPIQFAFVFTGSTAGKTLSNIDIKVYGDSISTTKVLDSISISGSPKTSYKVGEAFDLNGAKIYAHYTDSTTYPDEDVSSSVSWSKIEHGTTEVTGTYDGKTVIVNVSVTDEGSIYKKITSINELIVGAKVVIGTSNGGYTAGAQTVNSRSPEVAGGNYGYYEDSGDVLNYSVNTAVFTIGITETGYTFNDGTGYLYAASDSNNYLRTEAELDASHNGEWSVTIADGIATIVSQGTHTHNTMNGNGTAFGAYDSPTVAISLYADVAGTVQAFVNNNMHTNIEYDSDPTLPINNTGDCKNEDWYVDAKAVIVGLGADYIREFQTNGTFANALARYNKWAQACGDTTPFAGVGIVSGSSTMPITINQEDISSIIVISTVTLVSVAAVGGYFLLRKRKEF